VRGAGLELLEAERYGFPAQLALAPARRAGVLARVRPPLGWARRRAGPGVRAALPELAVCGTKTRAGLMRATDPAARRCRSRRRRGTSLRVGPLR
jgi:hypothetical protein